MRSGRSPWEGPAGAKEARPRVGGGGGARLGGGASLPLSRQHFSCGTAGPGHVRGPRLATPLAARPDSCACLSWTTNMNIACVFMLNFIQSVPEC